MVSSSELSETQQVADPVRAVPFDSPTRCRISILRLAKCRRGMLIRLMKDLRIAPTRFRSCDDTQCREAGCFPEPGGDTHDQSSHWPRLKDECTPTAVQVPLFRSVEREIRWWPR